MTIPNVTQTIIDPGLGLAQNRDAGFIWMGISSSGTANTVYTFSNPRSAQDTLGHGPLVEGVCHTLSTEGVGGPVRAVRLTGSIVGTAGAVAKTASSGAGDPSTGTITVSGTPYDAYQATVEITGTGTLGDAEFRYRLDKLSATDLITGTWSQSILVPSGGGAYAVPNTGLTLTFVPGAGSVFFKDGDMHTFACTAPYYSTTNLGDGFAAIAAASYRRGVVALAGNAASTSAGAAMFTAFQSQLAALVNSHQYFRGIMNAGIGTASDAKSDYAGVSPNRRATKCFGTANTITYKGFAGWGAPDMEASVHIVARSAFGTVSDDPARFSSGPEGSITSQGVSHDERTASIAVDEAPHSFATLRTFVGEAGYWVTNVPLTSPPGSDYVYIQHGRVMDLACATTYGALLPYLSTSVRVQEDGTIDPRDKVQIEDDVQRQLDAALMHPRNLDGKSHVSGVKFTIDGSYNVALNNTLQCNTAVRPLGYLKHIDNFIGYALNLSASGAA
jgi:hypothetical protein